MTNENTRKLATIRRIAEVKTIPEADLICAYRVDGWWVVDQVGKYQVNDLVIYAEPDSWIPHELSPFLSRGKEPREFEGIKGERLKTVKLKKQLSQGLLLPLSSLPHIERTWLEEGTDVTEFLGIIKWEAPVTACLAGKIKGNFPQFIPKTDQERIQNLTKELEKWSEQGLEFEVSEKLDGSSMTVYINDGTFGVCSRNLDLKESDENAFWKIARKHNLKEKLEKMGRNIALQGEIVGPGIQGNKYKLEEFRFYLFDVYDIDKGEYLSSNDRIALSIQLEINHVPVFLVMNVKGLSVDELLLVAENKSMILHTQEREGLVFKCISDPSISFKCISNKFLLRNGE